MKLESVWPSALVLLLVLCVAGCPSTPAKPIAGWTYDLYEWNTGKHIEQRADGGFLVGGTGNYGDERLLKFSISLDASGEMQNSVLYPDLFATGLQGAERTATLGIDGHMFFGGLDRYPLFGTYDGRLRVMMIASSGEVAWDNTYGDQQYVPRALLATEDGGVAVAIEIQEIPMPSQRERILKLNSSGGTEWMAAIPEQIGHMKMHTATAVPNGGFVAAGYDDPGDTDAALWAIDENGNHLWYYRYDRPGWHSLWDVTPVPDGGLYACGRFTLPSGKDRPYLLKVDADGVFEWDRADIYEPEHAGSDVEIWDMVVDDEGYIAIVGDEEIVEYIPGVPLPVIRNNCFMMRLDAQGNLVWKEDFPGFLYALTATTQGTYMATGVTGTSKRYLIRLIELDKTGKVVN